MSQLSGFDACKASLAYTNTMLDEILKELRLWQAERQQRSPTPPSPPPSAPLAAPSPAPPQTSPPAQKLCVQTTTPELPPQPPTPVPAPAPAPARSYPPSPSVETIEEVEQKQVYKIPLRNIRKRPIEQKHRASKTVSKTVSRKCVAKFLENWIAWPPRFGGIYMRFSRDEEPDAWYTTMLNATDALPYRT